MKYSRRFLVTFCVFFVLITASQISSSAAEAPRRIISLAPNITEILFAMDLGDRIIGDTTYCDVPDAAKKKPKVGGMSNPSLETVISLKPDVVIMTTDGNPQWFEERLRAFKIKTYVFRARKLSELPQGISDLGAFLGAKEKADALSGHIASAMKNVSLSTVHYSRKKKVLFIIWPEPLIVAGPGTEIDDAITLLGHENIASGAKISYPHYSMEEILHNPPDVILIGKGHTDMKEMAKGLLNKLVSVAAVKEGRIFFLSDSLYRLGPRVVPGIQEMAKCLN
jgi:iron complex transport system substrate-binding protein